MGLLSLLTRNRSETAIQQANPVVNTSSSHQHARASRIAVVEACINLITNCFRQSSLEPVSAEQVVKKELLASLIRRMLTTGESLAVMELKDGNLSLNQSVGWNITGNTSDPNQWQYQCQIATPSGGKTITTTGAGVIHFRYCTEPENPYQGFSPLFLMQKSAGTMYELDSRFDEEAQTSVGQILSMTTEADKVDSQDEWLHHYQYLSQMRGGIFVERQNRERGSMQSFAGRTRVGPEFALNQIYLRDRLHADISAAFAIPVELLIADGEGTGSREAFRRFVLTCIQPMASNLAEELSMKLDMPVSFSFEALRSADLQGIARGIKALTDAGLSIEEAKAMAGLQ